METSETQTPQHQPLSDSRRYMCGLGAQGPALVLASLASTVKSFFFFNDWILSSISKSTQVD